MLVPKRAQRQYHARAQTLRMLGGPLVHHCARHTAARRFPAVLLLTALFVLTLSAAGQGRAQAAPGTRTAGAILWSRAYQGPAHLDDLATDVAVTPTGNVCQVGTIDGGSSPEAQPRIRLACYTAGGDLVWQRFFSAGTGDSTWATALAVNRYGDVFVVGSASGNGTSDLLVLRYAADGTLKWARRTHGPGQGSAAGSDVAVDSLGNCYVTGQRFILSYVIRLTESEKNFT